jgi:hypothetical protein
MVPFPLIEISLSNGLLLSKYSGDLDAEFLHKIDPKILLKIIEARFNFEIVLKYLHLDPEYWTSPLFKWSKMGETRHLFEH